MKSLDELAAVDRMRGLSDFAHYCRAIMLAKGVPGNALDMARGRDRVVQLLERAPLAAGGAGGPGAWGAELSTARQVFGAFAAVLPFSSAFARMVSDRATVTIPLGEGLGVVASSMGSASEVAPGEAIPLRQMSISGMLLERRKVAAIVAMSEELVRDAATAEPMLTRALRAAVGQALDEATFTTLLDGIVAFTSVGLLEDLRLLLEAVSPTSESRLYWVMSPDVAITASTASNSGSRYFPEMGPLGGQMLNLPALVSSGVPAATLVLVDASRIAGNTEMVEVDTARQALIEMEDAPSGSAGEGSPIAPTGMGTTSLVSLWQQHCVAVRAVQAFGVKKVDGGAVASVFIGGSP